MSSHTKISPSKIKRKPAPVLADLLEADQPSGSAARASEAVAAGGDNGLTPTATGDFVLVPRPGGGDGGAAPTSNGIATAGEKKKGPPPVSKKPDNLRAVSTDAVRKNG